MFAPLFQHILPKLYFLCFISSCKSLCTSESLTSKSTCVYTSEKLDASLSSTSQTDRLGLAKPHESFATHTTTCHVNSQRRKSSASISPVEELLERIQWHEKNSPPCHSETLSRLRVANVTEADNTAYAQIFHLSFQSENVSAKLRLRSLLNRYPFLHRLFLSSVIFTILAFLLFSF